MMILQWSIFLFLLLNVENVQSLIWDPCSTFRPCEVSVDIKTQEEKEPKFNPLYLIGKSGSYELAIPNVSDDENSTDLTVLFTSKKKLIYACPMNLKSHRNDQVTPELLQQNDIAMPSSSELQINQHCSQKVQPMMKTLNKFCSGSQSSEDVDQFTLYEVGFKVFVRHSSMMDFIYKHIFRSKDREERTLETWHPLYKTCHNTKTYATLFTIHTLHGVSLGGKTPKFSGNFRSISKIDGIAEKEAIDTKTALIDNIYKQESVKLLFHKMFRRIKASTYADDDFLAKGHMVADADMTFIPWKNATYLYANAVPMWQYVNNGCWKSVEMHIRKKAIQSKQKFTIYTGVYGTVTYNGKQMFLGGENTNVMPIPLFLWKIIHHEQKNEAIAFVVINDPYTDLMESDFLCPPKMENGDDICSAHKWPKYTDDIDLQRKRKVMHCCTVQKLREKVQYAPDLADAKIMENTDGKNSGRTGKI